MDAPLDAYHFTVTSGRTRIPGPQGEPFAQLLRHGSMSVEYFVPSGIDTQQPHEQDELYVVVSGSGEFVNGSVRHRFGPGDVMFVPAGVPHRFDDFSDDFAVWVVFYGPRAGERA